MRVINFTAGTEGNRQISDISELGTTRVKPPKNLELQNSLENAPMTLKLSSQMLEEILCMGHFGWGSPKSKLPRMC